MASEPVDQIEAEAERARGRIAETIDALQDKLDPRRIVGDAVGRVQDGGRQFAHRATDTVKAHPVAIGAAVAAVGLALFARHRLAHATVDLGDDLAGYTDYDDGFGVPDAPTDDAYDPAERYGGGDRVQALKASVSGGVDSNPLVSILLGVAAGAALGALLPTSDAERRALGETGGRIRRAAQAAARQAADELGEVRERASEAARQARDAARHVVDAAKGEFKG